MQQTRALQTLVVAVAGMLIWTASLYAATEKRVALVVGNGAYESAGLLKNPTNDAGDISSALQSLGFEVTMSLDISGDDFAEAVEKFAKALDEADVALFYYSGHGIQVDGVNYLLPVDFHGTNAISVKRRSIDLGDIIKQMEASAKINLVFLDACRDNPFSGLIANKTKGAMMRGLADQKGGANTMIVYATAPGTTASDGVGRNSPFTASVLKNINIPGLEIETMMKRVTKEVSEETDNEQFPERLSKLTAEFYFKPAALTPAEVDETSEANLREISTGLAEWKRVRATGKKNVIEAYLEKYSHVPVLVELARTELHDIETIETAILADGRATPSTPTVPAETNHSENGNPTPVGPTSVTASDIQTELKRLGCYTKLVDGKWGSGSSASLASFNKYAKANLDGGNLDQGLLDALKNKQSAVCPSSCPVGMVLRNGDCQKIVCAIGSELKNGGCTPKPNTGLKSKLEQVQTVRKPSNCFMMDGQKMCE